MKSRHGRLQVLAGLILTSVLFVGCLGGGGSGSYSVSGTVVDQANVGTDGVQIVVTGGKSMTATTEDGGKFALTGLTGTCTLTPVLTDYDFEPTAIEVSKAKNDVRFVGTPKPIETYLLTVELGSGGGQYATGTVVQINADAPDKAGQVFDTWTSSGGGSFADAQAESTSFTMPNSAVTVTASYRNAVMADYFGFDGTTGTITEYHKSGKYSNLEPVLDPVIPASINGKPVTTIGEKAFQGAQIASVVIPEGVTTIAAWAFNNNLLVTVDLPESVAMIGEYAFCANRLTSIVIPEGITHLANGTFWLNRLVSVTIPTSVTHIGGTVFEDNLLETIEIPAGVIEIGSSAFSANNLKVVNIPANVRTIGRGAFDRNGSLNTLVIPDDIVIGGYAFYQSWSLVTSITIGSGVTLGENLLGEDDDFKNLYDDADGGAGLYKREASGWVKQ